MASLLPLLPSSNGGTAGNGKKKVSYGGTSNGGKDNSNNYVIVDVDVDEEECQSLLVNSRRYRYQQSHQQNNPKKPAGIPTGDEYAYTYDQGTSQRLMMIHQSQRRIERTTYDTNDIIKDLLCDDRSGSYYNSIFNKTHPSQAPVKRFKRHRNYYIWLLNQFRHWWKTSRLLVRMSGGYEYCLNNYKFVNVAGAGVGVAGATGVATTVSASASAATATATTISATTSTTNAWYELITTKLTTRRHQMKYKDHSKHAFKMMKLIGRGGVSRDFLKYVHPITRSIRIILAIARALEAHVDNRLYEVGCAEALAFMGNRCSRWIARTLVDSVFKYVVFPVTLNVVLDKLPMYPDPEDKHYDGDNKDIISIDTAITILSIIIMVCGFIRGILPFMFSFLGSAFGRKFTYATYASANYRWTPISRILDFHQTSGVYQDTELDEELYGIAREVATVLGECRNHDNSDTNNNRNNNAHRMLRDKLDFKIVGAGNGGYAVYKNKVVGDNSDVYGGYITLLTLHITPYGPSILNEMPMYVLVERQIVAATSANELTGGLTGGLDDSPASSARDNFSTMITASTPIQRTISGYTYSGAFFKMQEWASLTIRFHEELESYNYACNRLGTRRAINARKDTGFFQSTYTSTSPPSNLLGLKQFIRSGHLEKKKRKDRKRNKQIQKEVNEMIQHIKYYQKRSTAPKRIILYLEGLDCSGKSSTAGLICSALESSGYAVNTIQHNRPPTPYQRSQPWMSRCRFEYPEDVVYNNDGNGNGGGNGSGEAGVSTDNSNDNNNGDDGSKKAALPEYMALVWDRGPAGDFVYGKLNELSLEKKIEKYYEFRQYDTQCYKDGVLFCKLLFVTDKDSIASTLGKRLAHKHICRDLRTWLYANSDSEGNAHASIDAGLAEIELHIDPTDFIAFNKYEENLAKFAQVARNTEWLMYNDSGSGNKSSSNSNSNSNERENEKKQDEEQQQTKEEDKQEDEDEQQQQQQLHERRREQYGKYYNPWTVICTSKRHPARLGLLKAFRNQLTRYSSSTRTINRVTLWDKIIAFIKFDRTLYQKQTVGQISSDYVEERDHGVSVKATFQSMILVGLVLFYAHITWKFDLNEYV